MKNNNEFKTEVICEIIDQIDDEIKTVVIFNNKNGIEYIKKPDGTIISGNNKEKIAIDDTIIENNENYEFRVKTIGKEEETWTFDANEIKNIKIDVVKEYEYPIATENGVEYLGKIVELSYIDETPIYYSLDKEETWIEYTGRISIKKETQINVKIGKDENVIVPIVSKNIKPKLAEDALELDAYDGDLNTGCSLGRSARLIEVDESAIGKKIVFLWNYGSNPVALFYDKSGNNVAGVPVCNSNEGLAAGYISWYRMDKPAYAYIPDDTAKIGIGNGSGFIPLVVSNIYIEK